MGNIIVNGGNELKGQVDIGAAKNSVLPIISASILSDQDVIIDELPLLEDVYVICKLLKNLQCEVEIDKDKRKLKINTRNIKILNSDNELIRKMRASFLIMGPMLARFGYCKVSMPGGCNIGSRPIDLHLKGFKALGAEINVGYGYVEAKSSGLKGGKVYLDFPSVGATENIMMAASIAKGITIIENAAEEPEISDLGNFLNKMGAKIEGQGTNKIKITGVQKLKGVEYRPIYDRIEAGTFMIAAAITKSKITINGVDKEYLGSLIEKLNEAGVLFVYEDEKIIVDGTRGIKGIDLKTMPYPGFPTDMQAQMMTLLTQSSGTSIITETVFENRFMHVNELIRMGANIKIDGRTAFIDGGKKLTGCMVKATDLRAGAAMILAGLVAEGETKINDIFHIDRGYFEIEKKFRGLGADIYRI